MRYQVTIEGGFQGIRREYEGELNLSTDEKDKLLKVLENFSKDSNPQLRDGFLYTISFDEGAFQRTGSFDESNLPTEIREFIDKIQAKK